MENSRGGGRRVTLLQNGFVDKIKSSRMTHKGEISQLARIAASQNATKNLHQTSMEGVQTGSDMIQQYKLTQLSLQKQNEKLQEELENTKCSLEEKSAENVRLKKQVEELSKKNEELQETHVRILQEKEEQKNNYLVTEMNKCREENVILQRKIRYLKRSVDSLYQDLESSRAMEEEKEGKILDLRNQLSVSFVPKTSLEQKNNYLATEMNKCREENVVLQRKISDLDFDLNCLKKDIEYKDVRIREWAEKVYQQNKDLEYKDVRLRELTEYLESHVLENEKLKKYIECKDARLRVLTKNVESHLIENQKLKKNIESKDVRLRELTKKVESQWLEKGKQKRVLHETENGKAAANGEHENPRANGAIDKKTPRNATSERKTQAKSIEKRTPKDRITAKQVA